VTILAVTLSVAVAAVCVARKPDGWPTALGAVWALLIADTSVGHAMRSALAAVGGAFGLH
jgi:hypothetical protein